MFLIRILIQTHFNTGQVSRDVCSGRGENKRAGENVYAEMFFLRHFTMIFFLVVFFHSVVWRGIEGQIKGEAADSLMTTASPTVFTSISSSTEPAPYSFLLRTLRRNCSSDVFPTNGFLQWEEEIRVLLHLSFMENSSRVARYSCKARCGLEQRNTSAHDKYLPRCYCDNLCEDFGDCCFDFDELCRKKVHPEASNQTCFGTKHELHSQYPGYAVWNTCPKNWKEKSVLQRCQDEDENDLLRNLPVFDEESHVTYKNIFCARCNRARNTTYWKIIFDCKPWFNVTTFNFSSNLGFLHQRCLVDTKPKDSQLRFLKRCIPRFQDCSNTTQGKNLTYCQAECLRYAFPVCVLGGDHFVRFRNPQCALCNGFTPSFTETECPGETPDIPPPLTILFDFSSASKHIEVQDRKKRVVQSLKKTWSCSLDQVYDPYAGCCKKIVAMDEWKPNCTVIAFNKTDYERLPNGTVYLKLRGKIYSNITYAIRDNRLLLCVNFSRNFSGQVKEPGISYKIAKTPPPLHVLSLIGCILSMVSLVLLLMTYILFAELRNLPGKIIINLALSLLLYQSVFFSAAKTDDQDTCLAVAVLLHFFALSSFMWMNVMAYDVHRTFTNVSSIPANQQGDFKKRLMKYCAYAWGTPAIVVLICVTVDHVKKGIIGYGECSGQGDEECFISQPQAILYSFVLPVTLLMIFNLYALGHTVIHIIKTRKRTQQVTNQQHGRSVAVICVKMASVMGVTWILGIAANLKALSFLWYP
ncbi:hypothetical protein ACROYT_G023671 [Oculina patagonica]